MRLLLCTIICLGTFAGFAQQDPAVADSIPTSDSIEPKKSKVIIAAIASNNANYYGQKPAEKTPYAALFASYRHKSGLYVNVLGYRLLKDRDNTVSAYGAGAGFNINLTEKLSADLSYSHTFFPKLSPFLQAANPHMASANLTYESWVSIAADVDYAFGKRGDVFTTLGLSKQLTLAQPGDKDVIIFTPLLDATMGTQRFYEYYVEEKRFRDSLFGLPIPPIIPNPPGNEQTVTITESSSFDLLSYNLRLPVAYSRANYMIELACQLSLLGNKAQTDPGKLNTFFNASFYYQF